MTTIDIVITTYNRSEQLRRAIQSVLDQTDQNLVLTVLDNCSTDNTEEVCARMLAPSHRYVRNPENLGMVGNWNAALRTGNNKYVQILHDDDELGPDFVARMRAFIDKYPDCVFIHSGAAIIDQDSRITGTRNFDFPEYVTGDEFFEGWLAGKVSVVCPTAVFNRNLLSEGLEFSTDLPFTADLVFFLRASRSGYVGYIREPIFRYREHPASTTSDLGRRIYSKIADRNSAARQIQQEVDGRQLRIASPDQVGRNYRRFALASDVLFTRLIGGSLADVWLVAGAVVRAEPALLLNFRFYRMFLTSLVPLPAIRGLSKLLKAIRAQQGV